MCELEYKLAGYTWIRLVTLSDLDTAIRLCDRYVVSIKMSTRVVSSGVVVYTAIYDSANDPDARDWDSCTYEREEDFGLSWQECGF